MTTLNPTAALYEKILEAVPGGVVYVAHDGTLLLANQPAQDFLGLRRDEESKRFVTDFATETYNEDGSECPVEDYPVSRCLATARPQPPRVIGVRRPNGEVRWAVFTALPFHQEDGEPPGAVVSFVDITARKRAEDRVRVLQAELAQRERLATVGTLAAAVAHEINNPLSFIFLGIQNAAHALEHHDEIDRDALIEELDDVQSGADRVRDIVRDLMSFAKVRDDGSDFTDLNEAIKTAVRLAAPELRYRAQIAMDLRATSSVASAGRLSQVVLNLVLNAGRSFTESTGQERIDVTSQDIDGTVVIDVIDNGPGVELDIADRIFEPFFTTRANGSGLGLAISRAHVDEMDGTLELVERAGTGACFRITLPRTARREEATAEETPQAEPDRTRILLVDDESAIRRLSTSVLSEHVVVLASSVAEALDALEREEFDFVLCDTMLLDGSGLEVYRSVQAHRPALTARFLFMTGGAFTAEVEDFFATHDVEVMQKPFGREELERRIASMLES